MNNKQFEKITNEQLSAIVMRLKSQLLEASFKQSSGELQKPSVIKQIRRTIARILTELTIRGVKMAPCLESVILYDLKTNKQIKVITKKEIEKLLKDYDESNSKTAKKITTKKADASKKPEKEEVAKEVVKKTSKEAK